MPPSSRVPHPRRKRRHRHLAGADDHRPPAAKYVIGPDLSVRSVGEEAERLRAEDERLADEDRERAEQRKAEAEAIRKARERYQRENPGDDVMGVPISRIRVEK
jgi:hypothetical protein